MSGAGVVHYQLLHRPRSVPTALGPAPLATVPFSRQTVLLFLWHLTTGSSLRRERRRKLCRSPYFMKGSTTIGLGTRSETTSKQTPVWTNQHQSKRLTIRHMLWLFFWTCYWFEHYFIFISDAFILFDHNEHPGMFLTQQSDDVRMVKILHASSFIQKLFNLSLGEVIHWKRAKPITYYISCFWFPFGMCSYTDIIQILH